MFIIFVLIENNGYMLFCGGLVLSYKHVQNKMVWFTFMAYKLL